MRNIRVRKLLTNRKQRIQINRKKSELGNVTSVVPQGSILGPLLFIIYINDLETGVNSDISKFADDTKIARSVKNICDARMLQDDLNRLYEWSEKLQMEFNVNKFSIMSVDKGNRPVDYTLDDTILGRSYSVRGLGVQVNVTCAPGNSVL